MGLAQLRVSEPLVTADGKVALVRGAAGVRHPPKGPVHNTIVVSLPPLFTALLDYVVERHFRRVLEAIQTGSSHPFREDGGDPAEMVARWVREGTKKENHEAHDLVRAVQQLETAVAEAGDVRLSAGAPCEAIVWLDADDLERLTRSCGAERLESCLAAMVGEGLLGEVRGQSYA